LSYFDFNYVTDPPDDELVNPITQLNDNWQEVNDKIKPYNSRPNTLINPPKGAEAIDDQGRIGVWDGTQWNFSLNHAGTITSWQTFALRTGVQERAGFTPLAKVDTLKGQVILTGAVQLGSTATAWSTTAATEITTDTAIQASLAPVNGGFSYHQCATGQNTTANAFASAVVWAELKATPTPHVALMVRYQGDAGGGNFVQLDNVRWWFR
jgi:hypothetical protein